LLVGGGALNAAFAAANLIDEVVLTVEPYLIAKGITLFASSDFDMKLRLTGVETLSGGRLRVSYLVDKTTSTEEPAAKPSGAKAAT
jgi:riboflavin biosynthesis pyrimidine reductase